MRSRDGNHTFSLTIPTIVLLFSSLTLSASEYLISYRYLVHNAILYNDSLDISKSMRSCNGEPFAEIAFANAQSQNLKDVVNENKEEFIDFIHSLGLHVEHREKTSKMFHDSTTILTLKTTCFKVDFNDTFVKISALK